MVYLQNRSQMVTYTYDESGLRTRKYNGSEYTYYDRDASGNLVHEARNDGANHLYYYYDANGSIGSIIYNGVRYAFLKNLQGDVIAILDTSANIVARYTYDAWGRILSITDGNGNINTSSSFIGNVNPIRYREYYYDTETGWYYLNSRYYDPCVRRYINEDGQLNPDIQTGKNLYAYCLNNPVNQDDPTGAWALLDDIIAGGVGLVVGIGGQFVSDIVSSTISGNWSFSSWETYVGAGVGGAAGGVMSLYATPAVGAAVGSGISTAIGQGLEKITGTNDRPSGTIVANTLVDAGVGAALGSLVEIPGITTGRNSYSAVFQSGLTKIGNGTAKTMSTKVITKGIISGLAGDIYVDLYDGVIPGAEYWYESVWGTGEYMCYYNGNMYIVDGNHYRLVEKCG